MNQSIDWSRSQPFQVIRGRGRVRDLSRGASGAERIGSETECGA